MWTDPIVRELHRIRERHARQFGYDLRRIYEALKLEEAGSGWKVVSLQQKRKMSSVRVKSPRKVLDAS